MVQMLYVIVVAKRHLFFKLTGPFGGYRHDHGRSRLPRLHRGIQRRQLRRPGPLLRRRRGLLVQRRPHPHRPRTSPAARSRPATQCASPASSITTSAPTAASRASVSAATATEEACRGKSKPSVSRTGARFAHSPATFPAAAERRSLALTTA